MKVKRKLHQRFDFFGDNGDGKKYEEEHCDQFFFFESEDKRNEDRFCSIDVHDKDCGEEYGYEQVVILFKEKGRQLDDLNPHRDWKVIGISLQEFIDILWKKK